MPIRSSMRRAIRFKHGRRGWIEATVRWLDKMPWWLIAIIALLLGIAPITPQPHLLEKFIMLSQGTLVRAIDWADLALHGLPLLLLLVKSARMVYLVKR